VIKDLKAGDILTNGIVRAIRPGLGLPTKYLDVVLGKILKQDVIGGTALSWELFN
jgi:N-acetylneuraminate synthase